MSIENKLKQEYQTASDSLQCPPSLDVHMTAMLASQGTKWREGKPVKGKRVFTARKMVAAVCIAAVLSGFSYATQKFLFATDSGMVRSEVWTDTSFHLPEALKSDIHTTLSSVQGQLEEGQSAVIYIASLQNAEIPMLKQHPLLSTSKPIKVGQMEEWKQQLIADDIAYTLPPQLEDDFTFDYGKKEPAFGGEVSSDSLQLLDVLQKEAKDQGKSYAWRVQESDPNRPMDSFTTAYSNSTNDHIYVQIDHALEKVKIKSVTPETIAHEQVQMNGVEANYVENNQYLFSDTGLYKEVSWMVEDDESVMIRVSTDSINITKEQLIQAAESLK